MSVLGGLKRDAERQDSKSQVKQYALDVDQTIAVFIPIHDIRAIILSYQKTSIQVHAVLKCSCISIQKIGSIRNWTVGWHPDLRVKQFVSEILNQLHSREVLRGRDHPPLAIMLNLVSSTQHSWDPPRVDLKMNPSYDSFEAVIACTQCSCFRECHDFSCPRRFHRFWSHFYLAQLSTENA